VPEQLHGLDWCDHANFQGIAGLKTPSPHFSPIGARFVHNLKDGFTASQAEEIYREMGMQSPEKTYAAVWVYCGDTSLVLLTEMSSGFATMQEQVDSLHSCLVEGFLLKRIKLAVNCLRLGIPVPAWTAPKNVDKMHALFSRSPAQCTRDRTAEGIVYYCVQIGLDLTGWQLQLMHSIGFRRGNVVEVIILDWPSKVAYTGCRLTVTDSFLRGIKVPS
jgi:hypothetical protein